MPQQPLPDWLYHIDIAVWQHINVRWHTEWLDVLMVFLRNQYTWAPLYLFLLIWMPLQYKKAGWVWIAGLIITFAIADYTSASILKPWFHRDRPCNVPELANMVRLLVPRSSGPSLPSSHAANHFALATFMAITMHRGRIKWLWPVAFLWALAIAYAQVYVGVHYPVDVVSGGLLGIVIGALVALLYHRRYTLVPLV